MTFQNKLDKIVEKNNSLLSIGLDPVLEKIPAHLRSAKYPLYEFNKAIIDSTYDLICAHKPNSAFYEAYGAIGIEQLKMTLAYLNERYPELITIIDAKRADIGSTNEAYVKYAFEYLRVDGITLHPYLGQEALAPFLKLKEKGMIILCKTSNPGSGEFQDLKINNKSLYKYVAEQIAKKWNKNNNCMLVVGATYPDELKEVRKIVGDMTLLIPGIGAQGGSIEKTVRAGLNSKKAGMIIHSARSVIYASSERNFAEKARVEAKKLRDEINKYR